MSEAPAYWISKLAEEVAEFAERQQLYELQESIKRAAREHGVTTWAVAEWVSQEWDRWGMVRGDNRRNVLSGASVAMPRQAAIGRR